VEQKANLTTTTMASGAGAWRCHKDGQRGHQKVQIESNLSTIDLPID